MMRSAFEMVASFLGRIGATSACADTGMMMAARYEDDLLQGFCCARRRLMYHDDGIRAYAAFAQREARLRHAPPRGAHGLTSPMPRMMISLSPAGPISPLGVYSLAMLLGILMRDDARAAADDLF